MKDELEKALRAKYPEILSRCALDIDDGWHDLIDQLCAELQALADDGHHQVRATQVKQKWGALRFYVDRATDEQWALIEAAEEASQQTCERCGCRQASQVMDGGWMVVRCADCTPEGALPKDEFARLLAVKRGERFKREN